MKATPMTPCATARMVAVDELGELHAPRSPGNALENGNARTTAGLAERHEYAGNDEGGEEL